MRNKGSTLGGASARCRAVLGTHKGSSIWRAAHMQSLLLDVRRHKLWCLDLLDSMVDAGFKTKRHNMNSSNNSNGNNNNDRNSYYVVLAGFKKTMAFQPRVIKQQLG